MSINSYLYWSEVLKERSTHAGLKRSRLDGSNVTVILDMDQKRQPPRFLTFDAESDRLYWFEGGRGSIYFYATLDPQVHPEELMEALGCSGLAVLGPHIYWALQWVFFPCL